MSEPLWTAESAALCGRSTAPWRAEGVSIDSRALAPGDLFVALVGPRFDGHDFVAAAFRAGAAAALVHRVPEGLPKDAPLLLAEDTMAALERLGRAGRQRTRARILAITGSVGKTGTKEALRRALEAQSPTFAAAGSLNNRWGVPLSLARLPRDARYGIFELGMNHAGEIRPLARQVRPDLAIVTAIEAVHLEFFASLAAIADAKAEIFEGMGPGGTAVLNRDNEFFDRLAGSASANGLARVIGFGSHAGAEARLVACEADDRGSDVSADIMGERIHYRLGLPGRHWVMNSLAVLAALQAVGADLGTGAAALCAFEALAGRGRQHEVALAGGSFRLIDESYNASPAATRAALAVLASAAPGAGGRRIAVLGDMRELGDSGPRLHAELAPDLLAAGVDLAFTAGPLMERLSEALPRERRGGHAPDAARLVPLVLNAVRPGDVVLVKGSLGSRMGPIVAVLQALAGAGPRSRAANGE